MFAGWNGGMGKKILTGKVKREGGPIMTRKCNRFVATRGGSLKVKYNDRGGATGWSLWSVDHPAVRPRFIGISKN